MITEILNQIQTKLDNNEYITVNEYLINYNNFGKNEVIDPELWSDIRHEADLYYRLAHDKPPIRNSNKYSLYKGDDMQYIVAAINYFQGTR